MEHSQTPEKDPNKIKYLKDIGRAIDYLAKNAVDSRYSKAIEELLHAADLLANFWQEVENKLYPSLSELFETELTLAELVEFNELGDNWSERAIFLWSIHARELDRSQAIIYANLKYRHKSNQELTEEELVTLNRIQTMIDEEELEGNKMMIKLRENNPELVQHAQRYVKSQEVTKAILWVLSKNKPGK